MIQAFREELQGIEPGTIAIWSGTLNNIPRGWVLCDGQNETPDFRNRFVRGIPTSTTDPGTTGGNNSYTLSTGQLNNHDHPVSVTDQGDHNHTYGQGNSNIDFSGGSKAKIDDDNNVGTKSGGSHSHSLSLDDTGGGSSIDNQPSGYEVAFIMRS